MPKTNPDRPLCKQCNKRNQSVGELCRTCFDANKALETLPAELAAARVTKDWMKVAESLESTIAGIADGTVKATAAQASMVKEILNRAYGRPTKSQEDKAPAAGVVILPTFGSDATMTVCPNCGSKYQEKKGEENG